jgi:glycosyltransferase involved in cell wall biosynthesis
MVSIIVPAHNEAAVIGRLLRGLLAGAQPGEFDIVVVPNGCTDDTATVAQRHGPDVHVIESPVASKHAALRLGDEHAKGFPRLYVDADVELSAAAVRALAAALQTTGVLAAGPERVVDRSHSAWPVRWYYDVWDLLPTVRSGLYGRGVIAVSEEGFARIAAMPEVMGDDLAASVAFADAEKRIVPAAPVVVHAPRTLGDLIRRRVRSQSVVTQLATVTPAAAQARTSVRDLFGMLRSRPLLAPKLAVFLAVTLVARRRARGAIRRGDYSTWLRDESSRLTDTQATR